MVQTSFATALHNLKNFPIVSDIGFVQCSALTNANSAITLLAIRVAPHHHKWLRNIFDSFIYYLRYYLLS